MSLVSFQKFISDTMEYEIYHFVGPFSHCLTLADLFLVFLLLKVFLVIFQRKLPLIQWNMKYNIFWGLSVAV